MNLKFLFCRKLAKSLLVATLFTVAISTQPMTWAHQDEKHDHQHEGQNHRHEEPSRRNPQDQDKEEESKLKFKSLGEAWLMVQETTNEIEVCIKENKLEAIHSLEEERLSVALQYMRKSSNIVTGQKAKRLSSAFKQALKTSGNVHEISESGDQAKTAAEFKKLKGALKLVQAQYPATALKAPDKKKDRNP